MSLPRLCFLSYPALRHFAAPVVAEYAGRARIEVVDGAFDAALAAARARLARRAVDVFVSAGANASLIRRHLPAPVATIQAGGFDILQALLRARERHPRVGVLHYGSTIPELDAAKSLLNLEIRQCAYTTPEEARERLRELRDEGFPVVVGSSLVLEYAAQAGIEGVLAYSLDGIRRGFDDALELARVARLEAGRTGQLNAVLQHLQDAVLAVDRHGVVTAANPAMQRALGEPVLALVGRTLDALPEELALAPVLRGAPPDDGSVLRLNGRDWVAARRPLLEQGRVAGATLTLYEAGTIHEADNRLRIQQRRRQQPSAPRTRWCFDDLLGQAPAFVRTLQTAGRYARTELAILIRGESGTGKELLAQAIHQASARAARPFVAINCAALPEGLLESELFGHEEGAFTGARRGGQRGLFEAAHTGTLFLDEVGDMPLALQTRLLRVLQQREIQRLGSTLAIPVDVRVIAATHQPLEQMVAGRRFRHDLLHRLDTLRLVLPPLRERPGDVAALAQALLADALARHGSRLEAAPLLSPLLPALERHAWPGNVRELENTMERLAVFALQAERLEDLPLAEFVHECPEVFAAAPQASADGALPRAERARQALARCGGRAGDAAQALGVNRSTLWRWLREPPGPCAGQGES
ncbi:propionate catabolism operon regulatory protein PrpR [Rubrivivax gelatinosus]|uniref:Propionate catabolism operon transcriptional regulator n=1 Tax=Rubrivivax gelatinosus TaxID=28068 RepID=A0A4R2MGZ0_RUBGE|nr:propionate catabolism operon regulatory protein PrpR [Rubrivivax gelatinosus]MBK1690133.1 propionate catabolism operon regulatory protein PrpR [Rubrivivax gelatinosus]TCP04565.1 propionate catabolism operon transcriptional regulator [Rubrivivax gelatinosus]